jgi:phosphoglycolate phosphatase
MTKPYRLLVFDWDGTLMDSTARIVNSLEVAAIAADAPLRSKQQLRHVIGLGLKEAIDCLFGKEINDDQRYLFTQTYRQQYLESNPTPTALFEGVPKMLETMRQQGYQLAIATGKSRDGLNRVLQQTQLRAYFAVSRCADECHSKPNPAMLNEIMIESGINPEQALMVGDTEFDIEMGKRAGVDTVAVAQGAHSIEQLQSCNPLTILHQIDELTSWLAAKSSKLCS